MLQKIWKDAVSEQGDCNRLWVHQSGDLAQGSAHSEKKPITESTTDLTLFTIYCMDQARKATNMAV